MNRGLKGFLAKYDITHEMIGRELNLTANTIGKKIKNNKFNQREILILVKYFQKFNKNIDYNIFFEE